MQRDARALLWDVLTAASSIQVFVKDRTRDEFVSDALVRSAVERQLEVIGEAPNQLSRLAPDTAAKIPDLRQIVGLRNILIHGYAVVDADVIWKAVQDNIPELKDTVKALSQES